MSTNRFTAGTPLFVFFLAALAIAGLAYFIFQQQRTNLKANAQSQLAAIADLKADQITAWRRERKADAQTTSQDYFFKLAVTQWMQTGFRPDDRRLRLAERLKTLQREYDYREVDLLDGQGVLRLSSSGVSPTMSPSAQGLALESMRAGAILFSDLYRAEEGPGQPIRLDLFAPLFDRNRGALGVLLFRIDPSRFLYPLIQSWPVPSTTAETMLVERVGNDVLYLNDLRHRKGAALALRFPMTEKKLLSVIAAGGQEGQIEAFDYRGIPVLAGIRKIADSPWFIVAKEDQQEVYAPVHASALLIAEFTVILMVFAGLVTALWWWQSLKDELRISSYTRSLIEASLDPLVTINPEGKITDVNEATMRATGITREALVGSDFSNYFTEPEKARVGYQEVFTNGFVKDYPLAIRHTSGNVIDVLYNASVYRDDKGKTAGVFAAARDVTERKRIEQRNSQLAAIVESSDDAIFGKTLEGVITSWNRGAELIYGYASEEVLGKSISVLMPPGREDEMSKVLSQIREGRHISHFETLRRRKDGKEIYLSLTLSPVTDAAGNIIAASAIERDITERIRAEEELRMHRQHLEELVAFRTADLAKTNEKLEATIRELESYSESISHDLRVPVRAIDGFSHILLEDYSGKLDSEGQRLLNVVRESTVKLAQMIDGIIAVSRAGRDEMTSAWIDMDELVRGVAKELEPALAKRKVTLDIKPLGAVQGDAPMIRRVWTNLIDNAIKFTALEPEAVIEVGSTASQEETIYYVKDNGAGFDMQYANKLFGVFQRLHGAEFVGAGIGLAIVKRIVARHGGRVWAEGKVNEGATFYFTLPKWENSHR